MWNVAPLSVDADFLPQIALQIEAGSWRDILQDVAFFVKQGIRRCAGRARMDGHEYSRPVEAWINGVDETRLWKHRIGRVRFPGHLDGRAGGGGGRRGLL